MLTIENIQLTLNIRAIKCNKSNADGSITGSRICSQVVGFMESEDFSKWYEGWGSYPHHSLSPQKSKIAENENRSLNNVFVWVMSLSFGRLKSNPKFKEG